MKCLLLILLVLASFCSRAAWGQDLRFRRIGSAEGLSNNWVRCFFQDDTGMIWIGTSDGLDRFDGREIRTFRPRENLGKTSSSPVNSICRKGPGHFWVGTDSGLYTFDVALGQFAKLEEPTSRPVLRIVRDSQERLWLATDRGLWVMEPGTAPRHFEADPPSPARLQSNYVNTVFEDSAGRIWVGTKNGLSVWDEAMGTFRSFGRRGLGLDMANFDVLDFAEDRQGRIWIAAASGGLYQIEGDPAQKLAIRRHVDGKGIRVMVDRDNILWLALGGQGGLTRANLDAFDGTGALQSQHFLSEAGDPWSLSGDTLFCLFEDQLGDVWIGTHGKGVNYFSKRSKRFGTIQRGRNAEGSLQGEIVQSFFEEERFLWIGTNSGLERFDKRDRSHRRYRSRTGDESALAADPIFIIFKDSRGNLWVGGWTTGLNRFDYQTETFQRYMPGSDPYSIGGSIVYEIMEDSRGNLWVGTIGGGLNRFVYDTGAFERFVNDPKDPDSLAMNDVNSILETRDGAMYVLGSRVVERFDRDTGKFEHFDHQEGAGNGNSGGYVTCSLEDSSGRIWLGSSAGLEIFSPSSGTFEVFGIEQGLPSENIQALLEDDAGNLWISTSRGISIYEDAVAHPYDFRFRNISVLEGLSSEQFNRRAAMKGLDGTFYFGSANGVTYIDPKEISFNEVPPPIALTDMLLLESTPQSTLSYRSLGRGLDALGGIELPHDGSSFVLKFAALNYLNPEKNRYRYTLSGFSEDWIDAGTSNSVTYSQLPPGDYTFRVVGSNNDGVWSTQEATLEIAVRPPWWQTLWFRALALLAALGLLGLVYRVRFALLRKNQSRLADKVARRTADLQRSNALLEEKQREIEAQNQELQEHRENLEQIVAERTQEFLAAKERAEESDKLKSSFLMNMSHEIRTPMNAIIGFSALLKHDNLSEAERAEFIDVIGKNGHSLLVLIDDILDISLIQSDQVRFSYETVRVDSIFRELCDLYGMDKKKDVSVRMADDDESGGLAVWADPVRLRQVLNNLLSNAYKYTDEGEVRLSCRPRDAEVLFEVSDTGPGIALADQEKIFDHFYKVERQSDRLYPGTGIGLSICRKLVAKMGGRIWVESVKGSGSRFYFTLPARPAQQSGSRSSSSEPAEPSDLSGVDLLVAEDNQTNFDLISHALRASGAKVHRAKNGLEAVNFVERHRDMEKLVVLMDIKMPVMDGCEACRRIKRMDRGITILAVTAYALSDEREKIMESGFDDYLSKPIIADKLLSRIGRHCSFA